VSPAPRASRHGPPSIPGLAAALAETPGHPGLLEPAGVEAYRRGDLAATLAWLGRAVAAAPESRLLGNLGVVAWQAKRPGAARRLFRRTLALDPASAAVLNSLGVALGPERPGAGAPAHRRALALDAGFVEARINLGEAERAAGLLEETRRSLMRAIVLAPAVVAGLAGLGTALIGLVRTEDGILWCRRALAAAPLEPVAHAGLLAGEAAAGRPEAALGAGRRAIALLPAISALHLEQGRVLQGQDRIRLAERAYRRAIAAAPEEPHGWNALAQLAKDRGELDRAIALFGAAVERAPGEAVYLSNLLFALCFSETVPPAEIFARHREYERRFGAPLARFRRPHANSRDPERRLDVAYLSPDVRRHPGGYFFEAFLAHHDRTRFKVTVYSTTRLADAFTERLAPLADTWSTLVDLDDERTAERIRKDGIDILVECTGHMAGNRLPMLARKPAPVQVSFPLYPNTTGLDAVDYRIMDPYFGPPGAEALHSEILVRLPDVHVCYTPGTDAPEPPARPPCLETGRVTFGCFNNYAKVRDPVVRLWARILTALPESRLVLKWYGLGDERPDWVLDRFARHGVEPGRIVTLGFQKTQYDAYLGIDLTLDPFPANGGTTSCDSLWMGVPVVTLAGETPFSRVGLCHLTNLGLTELVAGSAEEYEAIVLGLARDPGRLERLRRGLRQRMAASPLVDGARYTRNLEAAYRTMWRRWCRGESRRPWPASAF
jgi:predicted O-linked N-acetylglucosamine transferase (SPINDLY family)